MDMISKEDFDFLLSISENGNRIRKDHLDSVSKERVIRLQDEGLLQYYFYCKNENGESALSSYWITTKGFDAISLHSREQQEKEENARKQNQADLEAAQDRRKQRNHDYLVGAFGALIGALVAIFLQHIQDIKDAAVDVFKLLK